MTTSTTTEIPPDCIFSSFGCCPDNYTAAHGRNDEGCCLSSAFGCCPDDITDAQGPSFQDLLENQAGLLGSPPHELRALCLRALQLALETRQSKMVALAVSGFFKLLRDTQFHSGYEEDDETVWLPCQLLSTMQSLPLHSEDTQVELLKVLLNMCCVSGIPISGQVVTQVVGVWWSGLCRGRSSSYAAQSVHLRLLPIHQANSVISPL
nr:brefeldin A-inhibited guanine nucleotide-exchange protein 3-like [Cherax quadricarinatus]